MSIIVDVLFVINKLILQLWFKLPEDGDHKDHAYTVFQYNANKVTYDVILYAWIVGDLLDRGAIQRETFLE